MHWGWGGVGEGPRAAMASCERSQDAMGRCKFKRTCEVLLALMLSSDSDRPLIIDQPEDNLDGEFIYTTLVPVLRRAKERRQIVIVTHNANIAVLGDAEKIIVLKSQSDRGVITTRSSIYHPETRGAACYILDGAC